MSLLMLLTAMILIVTIAGNFFLIAVVVKSDFKKRINLLLSAMLFGMMGWSVFILVNMLMPLATGKWIYIPGDIGYFFEKLLIAFAIMIFSSSFWFVEFFIDGDIKKNLKFFFLLFLQSSVFLTSFLDNFYFTRVTVAADGYSILDRQPLNIILTIFIFLHIVYPMIRLKVASRKAENEVKRNQYKILFSALLATFIFGTLADWVLPVYFNFSQLNALGPTFTLILVGGIVYSMRRYRFLDVRSVIQRSISYAFLLASVIGAYLVILFLTGQALNRRGDVAILLSAVITTVLGIFGSRPVERYFTKQTDKIFYKNKYDYSRAVHELSEILNINMDLLGLLRKTSDKLGQIFKVDKIEFLLRDPEIRFDGEKMLPCTREYPCDAVEKLKHYHEVMFFSEIPYLIQDQIRGNAGLREIMGRLYEYGLKFEYAISVPILLRGRIMGILFLGEKLSGERYTDEDVNLLKTFSYQAAIAIEKSRLYEAEKKYAGELEEKVRARTAKITKLQEEQRQMMVDISHGLQTPLAIIKGEVEFLDEQMPNNRHVKNFEKSIDQVSKFIYDMLNLARLETTNEDFRQDRLNLSELMEELVEYFDVLTRENEITIEKEIDPDVFVMGKKEKLEEVVTNLVSNSIKYIDNEKRIKISLKRNKKKARLVVEDTGMGINEVFLPNLFSRFYRVKDEKHAGIKGTGIGLSIVKQIVEKHGGTIRAESLEGKWTKMIVELGAID